MSVSNSQSEKLLILERSSKARLITSWMALGLSRAKAHELLDDTDVNAIRFSSDQQEKPIAMLIGDYGTGKSLQVELTYQRSIVRYREDNCTCYHFFEGY